jgi:mRNA-degrading endonuclease RelE of RelBE toxin-antitoxin system
MEIIFSEEFRKEYRKIKDKTTRHRIQNQIIKLKSMPESGKPLRYRLRNLRSIRVDPFRIIYHLERDNIIIICFDHRSDIYDSFH